MLQVHIGGAKRAGKSTLARAMANFFQRCGVPAIMIDVDEVRTEIFGGMAGVPDSEESMRYQSWAMEAIFNAIIPRVVESGGLPITVASHSRVGQFERAVQISNRLNTRLRFLLVEAPTLAEVIERSKDISPDDKTDMRDFSDPRIRQAFLDAAQRIEDLYSTLCDARITRIHQGSRVVMLEEALEALRWPH